MPKASKPVSLCHPARKHEGPGNSSKENLRPSRFFPEVNIIVFWCTERVAHVLEISISGEWSVDSTRDLSKPIQYIMQIKTCKL